MFVALLFILVARAVLGQFSMSQNHPELKWMNFETDHFKIIYHQGIETIAHRVAVIAEQVYGPITRDLGVEPPQKSAIVVTDYLDYSNGLSTPLGHYIVLWTKSESKFTTGDENWLHGLVAHEFTHLVNFWAFRAFPGYWRELIALGLVPTWFLEGVAQFEAEKWCANRDMLLRVATYTDRLLPYKKLTGYIGTDHIGSRLVYEQGHSLIRFITAEFGDSALFKIIERFRSFPLSFNLALKRSIGLSENELFDAWKKRVDRHYNIVHANHAPVAHSGRTIATPFQAAHAARWSPDGAMVAIVAMADYDEQVPDLYISDSSSKTFQKIAGPFVNSFFSWSPDSKFIVYSQEHHAPNGSMYNDVFIYSVETGSTEQLTVGERATDPCWSPEGKKIAYSVHQGTRSNLAVLDLESRHREFITEFPDWVEVFTPSWSPTADTLAFSRFDEQGNRDIWIAASDGSFTQRLIDVSADDRFPAWSPDGKKLAFIAYQNGAPNLHLIRIESGEVIQLTDTPGGVFHPTWLPDGRHIGVTVFEHRDRTDIVVLPDDAPVMRPAPVVPIPFHTLKQPVPVDLTLPLAATSAGTASAPYRSLLNVRSQILLPYLDQDENGWQPGFLNLAADPLGKHWLQTTFSYRTRAHFSVSYTNVQFNPTIQVYAYKTTIDHGDFLRISNDEVLPLYENDWGGSVTLSWPINFGKSRLSNHLVWLRGTARHRTVINDNDYERANIARWALPFQGWINYATLGYSWATYRPDVSYELHPKTGAMLSVYAHRGDRRLGSDLVFSQIGGQATIRWEWPFPEHVIATRLGATFRDGDQPIQSRLALGSSAIRGLSTSQEGDQQVFSNLEYRFPLVRDIGLKIWILYFERMTGALFLDSGKAWGSYFATLNDGRKLRMDDVQWKHTTGIELRHRFYFLGKIPVIVHAGYALELARPEERSLYLRVGPVF